MRKGVVRVERIHSPRGKKRGGVRVERIHSARGEKGMV